jgi:predicted protein tyrosine phosphatase
MYFRFNLNLNRIKTAEEMFRGIYNTMSAGLYNTVPVNEAQLVWADAIVVMEDAQRKELSERFPAIHLKKRILTMDIPDIYTYNQPELIALIRKRMGSLFKPLIE